MMFVCICLFARAISLYSFNLCGIHIYRRCMRINDVCIMCFKNVPIYKVDTHTTYEHALLDQCSVWFTFTCRSDCSLLLQIGRQEDESCVRVEVA